MFEYSLFQELEHKIISVVKTELNSFKSLLSPDYPECSERDHYDDEGHSRVREGLLKITLHILRKMNQTDLANTLQTSKSSGSADYNLYFYHEPSVFSQ